MLTAIFGGEELPEPTQDNPVAATETEGGATETSASPIEGATPQTLPTITETPETTTEVAETVATTTEETLKPAEDKLQTPPEDKLQTPPGSSEPLATPVFGGPETTTEPVQVQEKKDLQTEDVKQLGEISEPTPPQLSSPLTATMPMEGSSVDADNSTPLKEEANSTAPATPEPSVAISRPASSDVYQPSQQFTGPSTTNIFGGKQTSAYARLSTNETNPTQLAANTALSTESLMASSDLQTCYRSKFFVTPTQRSCCGGDRQRLRDGFNTQEIMMEMIFNKFDNDKNNLLDKSELRLLLQAYSSAHHINIDDAVKFILAVADDNQDGGISRRELLHGLQAWHAFNNMPAEVNRAMKNAGILYEGSPLPSSEDMRRLLKNLNGFIDADPEEIAIVRSAALAVGGTEERVLLEQMRMAISVWYTNVERKSTNGRAMMEFSLNGWAQCMAVHTRRLMQQLPSTGVTLGMVSVDDLEAPLQEEETKTRDAPDPVDNILPFTENKCNDTIGAILWLMLFILPGIFMVHVAEDYPTLQGCQHDLSLLLEWKGYLTLAIGFGGLMYQIVYDGQFRTFCLVVGLTSLVVSLMQEIVGVAYVLFSTPEKCGNYLWNVNALFFVWSLCWGPCLGCLCLCSCSAYFYSQEFQYVSSAESSAHRVSSPGRLVSSE